MLSTKGTHQVQIFSQLLTLKLTKFLVIFQATSQFSLQLCFGQKEPMKVQIFKFFRALMKVHPIPMPVLKPQVHGLLKFCISVHCIFYLKP